MEVPRVDVNPKRLDQIGAHPRVALGGGEMERRTPFGVPRSGGRAFRLVVEPRNGICTAIQRVRKRGGGGERKRTEIGTYFPEIRGRRRPPPRGELPCCSRTNGRRHGGVGNEVFFFEGSEEREGSDSEREVRERV